MFKDDKCRLVLKKVQSLQNRFKNKSLSLREHGVHLYMARARTETPTQAKRRERAPNKTGWK